MIKICEKNQLVFKEQEELLLKINEYDKTIMDLGTGDGNFIYNQAKQNTNTLCIGIDLVPENMKKVSNKIGKKPSRGGVNNLVLIIADVETLPEILYNTANKVHVNFPWSSLLKGVVLPETNILNNIKSIMKQQANLEMLINMYVFADSSLIQKLNLPEVTSDYITKILIPEYKKNNLNITEWNFLDNKPSPYRSTWGQRLTLGSKRKTVFIKAKKVNSF